MKRRILEPNVIRITKRASHLALVLVILSNISGCSNSADSLVQSAQDQLQEACRTAPTHLVPLEIIVNSSGTNLVGSLADLASGGTWLADESSRAAYASRILATDRSDRVSTALSQINSAALAYILGRTVPGLSASSVWTSTERNWPMVAGIIKSDCPEIMKGHY